MPERLECEVLQKVRYINTLTFTYLSTYSYSTRLIGSCIMIYRSGAQISNIGFEGRPLFEVEYLGNGVTWCHSYIALQLHAYVIYRMVLFPITLFNVK